MTLIIQQRLTYCMKACMAASRSSSRALFCLPHATRMRVCFGFISFHFVFLAFCLDFSIQNLPLNEECSIDMTLDMLGSMEALNRSLALFKANPASVMDDIILGVRLVKSNLLAARRTLTKAMAVNRATGQLTPVLDELIARTDDDLYVEAITNNRLSFPGLMAKGVMDQEAVALSVKPLSLRPSTALKDCHSTKQLLQYKRGHSTAKLQRHFTICVSLAVKCMIPIGCWESVNAPGVHSGYHTTHLLLYLMILSKAGCANHPIIDHLQLRKTRLCEQILSEAEGIEDCDFHPSLLDLFYEQIAFCGTEGHSEFSKWRWRKRLLTSVDSKGCFQSQGPTGGKTRRKRNDSLLGEGCSSHATQLGAIALSHIIKTLVYVCFDGGNEQGWISPISLIVN